jgi:hypothetical protein
VDLRAGLDDVKKRKFFTLPRLELRPRGRQPVASRYTFYATPPELCWYELEKNFTAIFQILFYLAW